MGSWTGSSWQSDTIFGHLCWNLRYLYGESELTRFLDGYTDDHPPMLLSNGFPEDLLPKPILPPSLMDITLPLEEQRHHFRLSKNIRDRVYLSREEFEGVLKGEEIHTVLQDEVEETNEIKRITYKNQIDRLTGTTGDGGQLFSFEESYWESVSVYLKVDESHADLVEKLFRELENTGYGKRKSVGYGHVHKVYFDSFEDFSAPADANGFVTLSNFVPSARDPTSGYWKYIVKYGKTGEIYSQEETAFKKPLLMLLAGSTFYASPCREFYGRLVNGISPPLPQVVQYAYALPVPIKLPPPANKEG